MSGPTWTGVEDRELPPLSAGGWGRAVLRGVPLALLVFTGLALLLLCRLIEAPIFGRHRPLTPWITVGVCRGGLRILGLRTEIRGTPLSAEGAMVANHASWLDIFVLNAPAPLYFVSKAEVATWPGIGWLARATGTLFINRTRSEALAHTLMFETRLRAGHRLMFFPEGTSSDGLQVLPFKSTLFQAFFSERHLAHTQVQPVSVIYHAPSGQSPRFYGWWGDMPFAGHLLGTLAAARQGRVTLVYHDPLDVADYPDRKALAAALETKVRAGHAAHLPAPVSGSGTPPG